MPLPCPSPAAGDGCAAVCGGSPRGCAGETTTGDTPVRLIATSHTRP